jgi:hypothetical protein
VGGVLKTTYACTPCGAVSDVTVSDLWTGPPDSTPEMQAGMMKLRAERELKFATCPRCNARNPVGVDEQLKEGREWRIGFLLGSLGLGVAIWFYPPLAWVLVVLDGLIAGLLVLAIRRVGLEGKALRSALLAVAVFVGLLATAIFYPRYVALFALYMTFQVARPKKTDPEEAWTLAKTKIQFAEPYR